MAILRHLNRLFTTRAPPQPVIQESGHPYTDDITLSGHVRIPGAETLRIEFDRQCSTGILDFLRGGGGQQTLKVLGDQNVSLELKTITFNLYLFYQSSKSIGYQ